jgi:hypothetical protein
MKEHAIKNTIESTNVYIAYCVGEGGKTHSIKFTKWPPTFEQISKITEDA